MTQLMFQFLFCDFSCLILNYTVLMMTFVTFSTTAALRTMAEVVTMPSSSPMFLKRNCKCNFQHIFDHINLHYFLKLFYSPYRHVYSMQMPLRYRSCPGIVSLDGGGTHFIVHEQDVAMEVSFL